MWNKKLWKKVWKKDDDENEQKIYCGPYKYTSYEKQAFSMEINQFQKKNQRKNKTKLKVEQIVYEPTKETVTL